MLSRILSLRAERASVGPDNLQLSNHTEREAFAHSLQQVEQRHVGTYNQCNEVCDQHEAGLLVQSQTQNVQTNALSALLSQKIQSGTFAADQTISLELLDNPNGVLNIKITRCLNNGWRIVVRVSQNHAGNTSALSNALLNDLKQCNIDVASLEIEWQSSSVSSGEP